MHKIVKKITIALFSLIVLLLIGMITLVVFVNPNKFKPLITAQVSKLTGRDVVIDGNLAWSFFPIMGVKVEHVMLGNPKEFKQKTFAEIQQATIGVKLMPLLEAKVEASGILLNGLKLTLIKQSNGNVNWDFTKKPMVTDNSSKKTIRLSNGFMDAQAATIENSNQKNFSNFSVNIPKLEIKNSSINWIDEQTNKTANISNFEMHAKNIVLGQTFPLSTKFHFTATNPAASGDFDLNAKLNLDPNAEMYHIEDIKAVVSLFQNNQKFSGKVTGKLAADMNQQLINLSNVNVTLTELPQIKSNIDLKANIAANLKQQAIKVDNLVAQVANLNLTGNANVTGLDSSPRISGHLVAQPFDLKEFLQKIGKDSDGITKAKMVTADFDYVATTPKTTPIQALSMNGRVKVDELVAAKVKANHLDVKTKLQNGILEFVPITAALYQGNLDGNAKIILTSSVPEISAQAKLRNVQAEPLLQDLGSQGSKIKVKGTANIDLQVTTSGTTSDTVIKNLNGKSEFSFKSGQLSGINIGKMIDTAYAFIKRQPMPTDPEDVTNFGDLTGTALIHNGVITNNDLAVTSPRFDAKGQGTIDLVQHQINYALQTTAKNIGQNRNDKDALNVYNYAIPITISGNLSNPSIHLDTGSITREMAKQQVKKVQDKVKDHIAEQLKDKIGEEAAGQAGQLLQGLWGH